MREDHNFDVLVYVPQREGCNQHGIYIGKLHDIPKDDGSGNFWGLATPGSEWTLWGWSYFEKPIVTHWMPLPALPGRRPPEGEEAQMSDWISVAEKLPPENEIVETRIDDGKFIRNEQELKRKGNL